MSRNLKVNCMDDRKILYMSSSSIPGRLIGSGPEVLGINQDKVQRDVIGIGTGKYHAA